MLGLLLQFPARLLAGALLPTVAICHFDQMLDTYVMTPGSNEKRRQMVESGRQDNSLALPVQLAVSYALSRRNLSFSLRGKGQEA